MQDVAILIKTFERPCCLERLLGSIEQARWKGPVIICDDSRTPCRGRILTRFAGLVTEYHCAPFDIGLTAGRNLMLRRAATPFFLLCDDDFVFDKRTDVARFRKLLESAGLDLIGGVYYDRMKPDAGLAAAAFLRLDWWRLCLRLGMEIPRKTFFNFASCGPDRWRLTDIPYTSPVVRCDFVANFFLARTQRVLETTGGWEESRKMGEHQAFFFRAKQAGLLVGHTEDVGVRHIMDMPPFYEKFRARSNAMCPAMFASPTPGQRLRRLIETWARILHPKPRTLHPTAEK